MADRPLRKVGIRCPHCGSNAAIRTSREISRTVVEAYHACLDVTCGHTFKSQSSIIATLSPSNRPSPHVHLPVAPPRAPMRRFQPAAANDDFAAPANDNPVHGRAEA